MFLLIRFAAACLSVSPIVFTFHNVSINTDSLVNSFDDVFCFTFHNVSINTHRYAPSYKEIADFTFHNVSINTELVKKMRMSISSFTFHNVSINTYAKAIKGNMQAALHSTMFLLIPNGESEKQSVKSSLHSTMFLLIPKCICLGCYSGNLYIPQCFY